MMDPLAHDALFSRFTFNAAVDFGPIWSPDGSRLLFSRQDAGSNLLYEKAAGGTGREERIAVGPGRIADWSRDGRLMLQESNGNVTVLVDRKPTPFLNTQFRERLSQFSPDSKWIAYMSDEGKPIRCMCRAIRDQGGKWQISTAGGTQPRWRRDGKELFYLAPDLTLMAVPISAANGFGYGVAKPLFHTQRSSSASQTSRTPPRRRAVPGPDARPRRRRLGAAADRRAQLVRGHRQVETVSWSVMEFFARYGVVP